MTPTHPQRVAKTSLFLEQILQNKQSNHQKDTAIKIHFTSSINVNFVLWINVCQKNRTCSCSL